MAYGVGKKSRQMYQMWNDRTFAPWKRFVQSLLRSRQRTPTQSAYFQENSQTRRRATVAYRFTPSITISRTPVAIHSLELIATFGNFIATSRKHHAFGRDNGTNSKAVTHCRHNR